MERVSAISGTGTSREDTSFKLACEFRKRRGAVQGNYFLQLGGKERKLLATALEKHEITILFGMFKDHDEKLTMLFRALSKEFRGELVNSGSFDLTYILEALFKSESIGLLEGTEVEKDNLEFVAHTLRTIARRSGIYSYDYLKSRLPSNWQTALAELKS